MSDQPQDEQQPAQVCPDCRVPLPCREHNVERIYLTRQARVIVRRAQPSPIEVEPCESCADLSASRDRLQAERRWQPIEDLPTGRVLVTNNITAKLADGSMSHVWIGTVGVTNDPASFTGYYAMTDEYRRIENVSHYHRLPPSLSERTP